jgi:protein SCO1
MSRRQAVALVGVLLAGAMAFGVATEGFAVFTTEGARRASVERSPRPLPDLAFEDQDGNILRWNDLKGRVVLTEFIYTRCPAVCGRLGDAFAQIAARRRDDMAAGRLALLSISFDPAHDGVEQLQAYAGRHGADGRGWRVVRPVDPSRVGEMLERFGVVVIPDDLGGYEHNGAVQVVDPSGRLVRVLDFAPIEAVLAEVKS